MAQENKLETVPYREGEPAPSGEHIRAILRSKDETPEQVVWIHPDAISKSAPLKRDDVGPLLPVVRWQWRHIGKYASWCRSFEDWELNFLREEDMPQEIGIWTKSIYAFLEFTHRNPKVDPAFVWSVLCSMFAGQVDLPKTVVKKIEKLYQNPPAEMADIRNFSEDGRLATDKAYLR